MFSRKWLGVLAIVVLFAVVPAFAAQEKDVEIEKKLGKEAAAEAEKSLKFITDEQVVKRVERIGQEIAAIAKTTKLPAGYGSAELTDFTYTFKVVDDKDVNAFALPAGYIYVNSGLLKRVESDDELAGVLAHEISHVAHHHMLKLLRKQSKLDTSIFLIIAAAAAGKVSGSDMQNIFYGAKLVEIAKLNSYSREAEDDADATAIRLLLKTKHNPVGMLTFIEKLARDQAYDPVEPGIFQTHPFSRDRANSIIALLKQYGVPIDRRAVSSGIMAITREAKVVGSTITEVVLGDKVVFQPADLPGSSSAERAKAISDAINRQIERNLQLRDVRLSQDGTAIYLKEEMVIDVRQPDAELAGDAAEAVAAKAKESIQSALLKEQMKLLY